MAEEWRNWSGSLRFHPARIAAPADEAQLVEIVRQAAVDGQGVRVVGAGRFSSLEDLARALKMDRSYVGRILRLTLLAPDIIMAILDGREPSGLSLGKLTKTLPLDWVEQRKTLGFPAV